MSRETRFHGALSAALRCSPRAALLLTSLLAVGCAGRQRPQPPPQPPPAGEVGYRVVLPESEGRHEVQRGQAASGGTPVAGNTVLPLYPPDWLTRGLPELQADALVVVDERGFPGRVDIDPSPLVAQCDACAGPFAQAVRDALLQWRFAPLEIADWIDGPDEDGDGEPDSVTRGIIESRPYSLRLQFSFKVRDGRAVVEQMP